MKCRFKVYHLIDFYLNLFNFYNVIYNKYLKYRLHKIIITLTTNRKIIEGAIKYNEISPFLLYKWFE